MSSIKNLDITIIYQKRIKRLMSGFRQEDKTTNKSTNRFKQKKKQNFPRIGGSFWGINRSYLLYRAACELAINPPKIVTNFVPRGSFSVLIAGLLEMMD